MAAAPARAVCTRVPPWLRTVTEVSFDGRCWQVAQQPDWQQAERIGTGSIVWGASLRLGAWLLAPERKHMLRNKSIVELGAGCGALAMMLSSASPQYMLATDRGPVLPLLQQTIHLNKGHSVQASVLEWGACPSGLLEKCGGSVDIVVGSELLYAFPGHDTFTPLQRTLNGLIGPHTKCYLAYSDRGLDVGEFFNGLDNMGIDSSRHINLPSLENCDNDLGAPSRANLVELTRKPILES